MEPMRVKQKTPLFRGVDCQSGCHRALEPKTVERRGIDLGREKGLGEVDIGP